MHRRRLTLFITLALAEFFSGCATTQLALNDSPLRPLERARVRHAIDQALTPRGIGTSPGGQVRLGARHTVPCLVRFAQGRHCIAWLTEPERSALREVIAPRAVSGLVVTEGVEADRGVRVLVLDAEQNGYEPDPDRASETRPTVTEVEDRVTRTVIDWVTWLRTEGVL